MSMTSKVRPDTRQSIINILVCGTHASNRYLATRIGDISLRSIQEATQKMTREGSLSRSKIGRYTFYQHVPSRPSR